MVILVPPDRGPAEGCTRVKYGDWKDKTDQSRLLGEEKEAKQGGACGEIRPADHEGEGLGGDGFVVLVDAVSDAHFHLSLLHPVTRGVVQPTHDPGKTKRRGDELRFHSGQSSGENIPGGSESRSFNICTSGI